MLEQRHISVLLFSPNKWEGNRSWDTCLDKAARVGAHQIRNDKTVGRRNLEFLHACLDELEDCDLGLLGVGGIGVVDAQLLSRPQRVVDEQQRIARAQEIPEGIDWICRVEVQQELLEARHLGQALLEGDAYLVEGARGVGLLVDDVTGGHHRAIGNHRHVAVE